ncbi:hypothetical protein L195_g040405 [Trifolium pratense]|uniref:Uncharacterized protein n=1 Tax=Trifolium pratense TaxID=57577 RepID=A0A2K3M0M7_TRIPR|nr:hypothetical protein L195_g040405 [Trifolium pratense]
MTPLRSELAFDFNMKVVALYLSFPTHFCTPRSDIPSSRYGLRNEKVESFTSGTRKRKSTLALGYLGDREESGSVAPKEFSYGDLVDYVPIMAEEVQNMLKNFREAIGSNGDQTWELVGLLEVVGYKESLMLQLVELT